MGRRLYIQVDKPLYKPGESVWIKTWDLRARDLAGGGAKGIHYQLINPRGSVVMRKLVRQERGLATNDFALPSSLSGGEYKIRVLTLDGKRTERGLLVSTYEAPRIKKKLEFLRKAYGPGDRVRATIAVKRATGEALGDKQLQAVVRVDGRVLPRLTVRTNPDGDALVAFTLPKRIALGDGLLTVLVRDGGVTESVSKRIPILLRRVQLTLYPEGGTLVTGLQTRVYFAARNTLGKPADVAGQVVDDQGRTVARFSSYFHGMGRFFLRPEAGRSYRVVITKPEGITSRFTVPEAEERGCVLSSYDDLEGRREALVVRVQCTQPKRVIVTAVHREQQLDTAVLLAGPIRPAVAHLKSRNHAVKWAQGVARVTLFDEHLVPLAERVVYRNRHQQLRVTLTTARRAHAPRDEVILHAHTTDRKGRPVPAELALVLKKV